MTRLSERAAVWPARAVWAVTAVLVVANAVLIVVAFPDLHPGDRFYNSLSDVGGLLFASIGLLIVVRARNVIGSILMGPGIIILLASFGEVYPTVGLRTHPASLPAPDLVSAILQPMFPLLMVSIAVMLLVYPVGAPPSPRWRPVLWVAIAGGVMSYLGLAVLKESVTPIGGLSFPNPLAIRSLHGAISTALVVVAWITVLAGVACLWGLVVRFRRGDAELRQQVKWLGFAASGAMACLLLVIASLVACNCDESGLGNVGFVGFFLFVIVAVPVSIAVAILKYRLYEIDVIIGKAVLYGLLGAFFTAV